MAMLTLRVKESTKAEIETLVHELGLWQNQSDFVKEAIEIQIRKYWKGGRFGN